MIARACHFFSRVHENQELVEISDQAISMHDSKVNAELSR